MSRFPKDTFQCDACGFMTMDEAELALMPVDARFREVAGLGSVEYIHQCMQCWERLASQVQRSRVYFARPGTQDREKG